MSLWKVACWRRREERSFRKVSSSSFFSFCQHTSSESHRFSSSFFSPHPSPVWVSFFSSLQSSRHPSRLSEPNLESFSPRRRCFLANFFFPRLLVSVLLVSWLAVFVSLPFSSSSFLFFCSASETAGQTRLSFNTTTDGERERFSKRSSTPPPYDIDIPANIPSSRFFACIVLAVSVAAGAAVSVARAIKPLETMRLPPLSKTFFLSAYAATSALTGGGGGAGKRAPSASPGQGTATGRVALPNSPPSALGRQASLPSADLSADQTTGAFSSSSSMGGEEGEGQGGGGGRRPGARSSSQGGHAEPGASSSSRRSSSSGRGAHMVEVPRFLYGTAWKKDRTETLVKQALDAGFTGIDTACQPKHYNEPGVGRGIQAFLKERNIPRHYLFIQTKFTPIDGQDLSKPLPYDSRAPLRDQVKQSIQTSLKNLGVEYLDSLLLHSPLRTLDKTLEAWRTFEEAVDEGLVRLIGLSNCYDIATLQCIYTTARHKPRFLQNRFYADTGYDAEIRVFCAENGIVYEAFWTLTANPHLLRSTPVLRAASRLEATPAQIWFRYLLEKGMIVLTGTTSQEHMEEDLNVLTIDFSREDFDAIDREVSKYTT